MDTQRPRNGFGCLVLLGAALAGAPPALPATDAEARNPLVTSAGVHLSHTGVETRSAVTGKLLWQRLRGAATRAPVAAGDSLLVAHDDGLHAFDRRSGAALWQAGAGLHLFAPRVADGVAYAGSGEGVLVAVTLRDGTERWRRTLPGWVYSPAVAGAVLVAGGSDATLHGFSRRDGSVLWRRSLAQELVHRPVAVGGDVVVTTFDGGIERLHAASGRTLWRVRQPTPAGTPASAGETLVFSRMDGVVLALRVADGTPAWQTAVGGRLHAPRVAGGRVLVADESGVVVLDAGDGRVLGRLQSRATPADSPAASGRAVLLATRGGLERHFLPSLTTRSAATSPPSPRSTPP